MYDRIVIPLDGSKLAERAIPYAIEMHGLTKAPIVVLQVVDLMKMEGFGPYGVGLDYSAIEPILNTQEQETADYLSTVLAQLDVNNVKNALSVIRRGSAAREICEEMQIGDLFIMASQGRGGVSRWLMGSVAEDVVRHATVPVMMVPTRSTTSEE